MKAKDHLTTALARMSMSTVPFGQSQLSWRQTLAVLAGTAAVPFAVVAFGKDAEFDPIRHIGKVGLGISLVVCALFTIWSLRLARRHDLVPDILGEVAPSDAIYELGRCHLHFIAEGGEGVVEIAGCIQNLNDGPGRLVMGFEPPLSTLKNPTPIPDLDCQVPPASVIQVKGQFASSARPGQPQILYLEGKFHASGRQVRFTRRRAATLRVNPLLSIALAFNGHLHAGGGTCISFTTIEAGGPHRSGVKTGTWEIHTIWQPT